ncbi:hypothetical protein QEA29_003883 [Salmonella enterica]|nr:hypothetical protein [Salmonella enterica subsp. enterica]EKT1260960.1 hypothetical protein [Salmonella enterica]EKT1325624.1 hypothetical protein [Salmonella enterica]EKT1358759.1 hypothetical protein [Salmonella enterica]EKT2634793.1 hypothetical protein [Salmonella enterica]
MGWLFCCDSRSALIEHLTRTDENDAVRFQTLKYALRGNIIWAVVQVTAKQNNDFLALKKDESLNLIFCHLLQKSEGLWGYKSLCEDTFPLYYTCPLRYLELAPVVRCASWRESVRVYHDNRKRRVK